MGTLRSDIAMWLADFQLLAAALLLLLLLLAWRLIAQPAKRLAVAKAALFALAALALLCSIPGWSLIHLAAPSAEPPLAEVVRTDVREEKASVNQLIPHLDIEHTPVGSPESAPIRLSVIREAPRAASPWPQRLALGFLGGSTGVVLWLLHGAALARRLLRTAEDAPRELVDFLRQLVQGDRPPRLLVTSALGTPVAVGVFRPAILLPARLVTSRIGSGEFLAASSPLPIPPLQGEGAGGIDEVDVRAILAHELAHIRNGDLRTLAASRLLLVLLWPQPLYWWLRRLVRLDQETLADAAATAVTSRVDYAEQLLRWARESTPQHGPRLAAAVGLWEGPSQLRRRVAILLNEKLAIMRSCSRRWRVGSAAIALAAGLGLSLVTIERGARQAVAELQPASPAGSADSKGNDASNGAAANPDQLSPELKKKLRAVFKRLKPTPNTIRGICLDPQGNPVAGADVKLYCERFGFLTESRPQLAATTRTDAKGEFSFENVIDVKRDFPEGVPDAMSQGREALLVGAVVEAPGLAAPGQSDFATQILKVGHIDVFRLKPAATLTGRVTASNGKPVADAEVSAGYEQFRGLGLNAAKTDAEGRYKIDNLEPWDAEAQRRWFEHELKKQKAAGRDALFAGTSVTGGAPQMPLTVRHPDFAISSVPIPKIPGEMDVQLQPGAVIEGRVLYQENGVTRAAAGVNVVAMLEEPAASPTGTSGPANVAFVAAVRMRLVHTDDKGRYRIASLEPGKFSVIPHSDGWVSGGHLVTVQAGKTVSAPDLLLNRGVLVNVQAVDAKTGKQLVLTEGQRGFVNPLRVDSEIRANVLDNNMVRFSADGKAQIRVPSGRYKFTATIPLGDASQPHWAANMALEEWNKQKPLEVREGETYSITLKMSKVTPQAANGKFIPIDEEGKETKPASKSGASPSSDASGLEEQPKHNKEPGAGPGRVPADKTASTEGNLGTAAFSSDDPIASLFGQRYREDARPNELHVRCLDEKDQPLPGAEISVYLGPPLTGPQQLLHKGRTDEKGNVTFKNLIALGKTASEGQQQPAAANADAMIAWVAQSPGRTSREAGHIQTEFVRTGVSVDFMMPPAATLTGRVTDETGKAVAGASVVKLGRMARASTANSATTDANGNYAINDLAPFDLAAELKREEEQKKQAEMQLAAGADVLTASFAPRFAVLHPDYAFQRFPATSIPGRLDAVLKPGATITGRVLSAEGNPAANVVVQLQTAAPKSGPWGRADYSKFDTSRDYQTAAVTDAEGRYKFTSLQENAYNVWADSSEGFAVGVSDVKATPGQASEARDLKIVRPVTVRAQLIDQKTGEPIEGGKDLTATVTWGAIDQPSRRNFPREQLPVLEDGVIEVKTLPGQVMIIVEMVSDDKGPRWMLAREAGFKPITAPVAGDDVVKIPMRSAAEPQVNPTRTILSPSASPKREQESDETNGRQLQDSDATNSSSKAGSSGSSQAEDGARKSADQGSDLLRNLQAAGEPLLRELAGKYGYALQEGENIKRVAPPFPDARMEWYRTAQPTQAESIPKGPDTMLFHWSNGRLQNLGMSFGGYDLDDVLTSALGVYPQYIEGLAEMREKKVSGDWVVRPNAPRHALLEELEQIVSRELGMNIQVRPAKVQRDVYVARGTYKFTPIEGQPKQDRTQLAERVAVTDPIRVFGAELVEDSGAGGGMGDFTEFLNWVGRWTGTPIVNEAEGVPKELSWSLHEARPAGERGGAKAQDPKLVLANIGRQTGLQFAPEKREIEAVVVTSAQK